MSHEIHLFLRSVGGMSLKLALCVSNLGAQAPGYVGTITVVAVVNVLPGLVFSQILMWKVKCLISNASWPTRSLKAGPSWIQVDLGRAIFQTNLKFVSIRATIHNIKISP